MIVKTLDCSCVGSRDIEHPNLQHTIQVAERLLSAGRAAEALDWVRRTSSGGLRMMRFEDIADAAEARDPMSKPKTLLEAHILEALGRGKEAQALRWKSFETTVDADILRAYVAALPEFEEFEVLDRAFAHALASPSAYAEREIERIASNDAATGS